MSVREHDTNGFFEIPNNPISKVGVFPYSGRSIGAPDPNKTYMVYRPAEELGSPETLKSFRLQPLINDHTMLGAADQGLKPAEEKGVHGCIGEKVTFDGRVMRSNLKIWSQSLAKQIKGGKRELSAAYRCQYDFTPGVFEGVAYDAVQRNLRGNHLALVKEGRMGPEVAVLDHGMIFALDGADMVETTADPRAQFVAFASDALAIAEAAPTGAMTPEILGKLQKAATAMLGVINEAAGGGGEQTDNQVDPMDTNNNDTNTGNETVKGGEGQDSISGAAGADRVVSGADAADVVALRAENARLAGELAALKSRPALDAKDVMREIAQRDGLAARLKRVVPAFDHAEMTLTDVAKHGVTALKLTAADGHEVTAVEAYLAAATPARSFAGIGADTTDTGQDGAVDIVADYINPKS